MKKMGELEVYDTEKIKKDIEKTRGYSTEELVRSVFVKEYLETHDLSELKLLDEKTEETMEVCKQLYAAAATSCLGSSQQEERLKKTREACAALGVSKESQERLEKYAKMDDFEEVKDEVLVLVREE